jgi:hypothetical protein
VIVMDAGDDARDDEDGFDEIEIVTGAEIEGGTARDTEICGEGSSSLR